MSELFIAGQIVRLKSGGPAMTIERRIDGTPKSPGHKWQVLWFCESKVCSDLFIEAVIQASAADDHEGPPKPPDFDE